MTDDDTKRLRELAERARKPQGWKRIAFQAARLDEFREAASPDVVIRLLDELDRLRHENHNLNWALGTDGYEQMYTEAERVEHADAVARITEHLDRLAARKARLDALVPAGVDILDHIDVLLRLLDERDALREAAREAEREACARVCEGTTAAWTQLDYNAACMDCATAIRNRAEGQR